MEISQEQASNPKQHVDPEFHIPNSEREDEQTRAESSNVKKRKKPRKRSKHWEPYTEVVVEEGDPPVKLVKDKCKVCFTLIAADSTRNGTSALKSHTNVCNRRQAERNNQTLLSLQASEVGDGTGSLTNWRFDQNELRQLFCEMIIVDELPFRFVEHQGFRKFITRACPQFKIPGRKGVKRDSIRTFLEHKEVLKSFLAKKSTGRVSLTTDCWTSINNTSYICVTAHFIGGCWDLNKKILSFKKIDGHRGDDIANSMIETLTYWELNTILCCTMDNASANDKAIHYVRGYLENQKKNILSGKYIHLCCVAHIINLVVSEGLEEIGHSLRRVREAMKWIKSSSMRTGQFQTCVKALQIDSKRFFSLDVQTRWNLTYLMLEAAESYEEAFKMLCSMKNTFVHDLNQKKLHGIPVGPLEDTDWVNIRKMIEYLKNFYDLTCFVSGTTYPTSHLLFSEICDVFEFIYELEENSDIEVASMASKMKTKVGKYWLESDVLNPKLNKILYIAAVLDPRQKMKHVKICLKNVYGDVRASEMAKDVKDSVVEMFDHYKKMLALSQSSAPSQSSTTSQSLTERCSNRRGTCSLFRDGPLLSSDDENEDYDYSELTVYLAKKYKKETPFDILVWWSKHGVRFPILSEMAKDILAIPISTVASESAFSTGGRVLDAFRSSLDSSTVETLICTEDWLRCKLITNEKEENLPEEEQEEEFQTMLGALRL